MTHKKNIVDSTVLRLKAKEIYGPPRVRQTLNPSWLVLSWLAHTFQRRYGMKDVKLAGKAGSADQEAAK